MDKEIFVKLCAVIRKYTGSAEIRLTEETKLRTELGLSSFKMLCLLGDVEDAFSVTIRYEDAGKLLTLGDVVRYICGSPSKGA